MFHQKDLVLLDRCLACDHSNLKCVLYLNDQPLANSFLEKPDVVPVFPLAINVCQNCFHVQLTHAVNPELMFKEYLYVSGTSNTMKEHFKWFANFTTEYYSQFDSLFDTVLDIGCNDGSQLDEFRNLNVRTTGIDPAENLAQMSKFKGHKIFVDYFGPDFILSHDKTYDIITAQNVFAHNYAPCTFLKCARKLMHRNSKLFVQTSQADMILNGEFDTIYHEHISFFNINSMNTLCTRAGLYLVDVVKCPLHGNSYIFVISRNPDHDRPAHIQNLIAMEKKKGLMSLQTYANYEGKCLTVVNDLIKTVEGCRTSHKIVGYGAAAKGMTLLNFSGIVLDYIIDDNPMKQGKFTPGSNIEICSIDRLDTETRPIMFIPLAWNFFDEIKTKIKAKRQNSGDVFCTYFPWVEISV